MAQQINALTEKMDMLPWRECTGVKFLSAGRWISLRLTILACRYPGTLATNKVGIVGWEIKGGVFPQVNEMR